MTEPLKCDKCGNTSLTILSNNIQGLNKVIDIYFCRKCQAGKTVVTLKGVDVSSINEIDMDNYGDVDDAYETLQEPENPYEDDDGGWDPSIG